MIALLYIALMPELHPVKFDVDLAAAVLYYSDIQWLIGGIAKLTHLNKLEENEKLKVKKTKTIQKELLIYFKIKLRAF